MRSAKSLAAVLLVCSLAFGLSSCAAPGPPPNIILVSIDTLRADHLGSYGYERATSPILDALAADGVLFETALAPAPWTFPSHAAMFSGSHPLEIGIDNSLRTIPDEVPLLAERLAAAGYQAAAFADSGPRGFVGADRGFGRGFEHYAHAPHREGLPIRFDIAATVDAALEWLRVDRDPERPFFLFLHTKSVHAVPNDAECQDERCFPYDNPHRFRFVESDAAPYAWTSEEKGAGQRYLWSLNAEILEGKLDPKAYSRQRLDVLKSLYDSGIYYVDQELGRLFDKLREQDLFESTTLVITSDHGEAFLDHTLFMHQEVYDTQIRIPLIVHASELKPARKKAPVSLTDIAPTILESAGVEVPTSWSGRPLPLGADGVEEEGRDHVAYYLFPSKFTYHSFALRRGSWKLVFHNVESPETYRYELYDLANDPYEQRPVVGMDEKVEDMRSALRRRLQAEPLAQGRQLREHELPEIEAVRALGYVE